MSPPGTLPNGRASWSRSAIWNPFVPLVRLEPVMKLALPARRRATAARRSYRYLLSLEVLEVRLPPGDCLLSSLFGFWLSGQNLSPGGCAAWAAESGGPDAPVADHRTRG